MGPYKYYITVCRIIELSLSCVVTLLLCPWRLLTLFMCAFYIKGKIVITIYVHPTQTASNVCCFVVFWLISSIRNGWGRVTVCHKGTPVCMLWSNSSLCVMKQLQFVCYGKTPVCVLWSNSSLCVMKQLQFVCYEATPVCVLWNNSSLCVMEQLQFVAWECVLWGNSSLCVMGQLQFVCYEATPVWCMRVCVMRQLQFVCYGATPVCVLWTNSSLCVMEQLQLHESVCHEGTTLCCMNVCYEWTPAYCMSVWEGCFPSTW